MPKIASQGGLNKQGWQAGWKSFINSWRGVVAWNRGKRIVVMDRGEEEEEEEVEKIPTLKARTRYRTFLPPSILNGVLTIGSRATRRFFRHPLPPPRREILFIARDTASRRRQRRRRGKFAAARSSKRIAATKIKPRRAARATLSFCSRHGFSGGRAVRRGSKVRARLNDSIPSYDGAVCRAPTEPSLHNL